MFLQVLDQGYVGNSMVEEDKSSLIVCFIASMKFHPYELILYCLIICMCVCIFFYLPLTILNLFYHPSRLMMLVNMIIWTCIWKHWVQIIFLLNIKNDLKVCDKSEEYKELAAVDSIVLGDKICD